MDPVLFIKMLPSFELARIGSLEIALGCLMVAKQKSTSALRVIAKMNSISIDFAQAQMAAKILRPKFSRIKVYLPPYALQQVRKRQRPWWFNSD